MLNYRNEESTVIEASLFALVEDMVESLRKDLYPRYLEALQFTGKVEIHSEKTVSTPPFEGTELKLSLAGFEIDPWDMSRVCDIATIGDSIIEDEVLMSKLKTFMAKILEGANDSLEYQCSLCFMEKADTFHKLVFSLQLKGRPVV